MIFEKKESDISTEIVDSINSTFGPEVVFAYKTPRSAYGRNGISDIHLCMLGHFATIEVKRPDKRDNVSTAQAKFMLRAEQAGGRAYVFTSATEALLELDRWYKCLTAQEKSKGAAVA